MFSTPHIIETALLILAAFLIGSIAGYFARRIFAPMDKPAAAEQGAAAVQTVAPEGAQLVVAPEIKPIPGARPRRSAAERLAAAAGRSPGPDEPLPAPGSIPPPVAPAPAIMDPLTAPAAELSAVDAIALRSVEGLADAAEPDAAIPEPSPPTMQPARVAGQATSGVVVPAPTELSSGSEVLPEPVAEPVRAEDVPQIDEADVVDRPVPVAGGAEPAPVKAEDVPPIDEAAHVVDRPVAVAAAESPVEPEAPQDQAPAGPAQPEPSQPPSAAEPEEDTEAAAMRAIEGGWTPPRRSRASGPVPHPERASADVETSLANARSSVAAATAAVEAAVAEASVVEPEAQGLAEPAAAGLDFGAGAPESAPQSFLADGEEAQPGAGAAGRDLVFEPSPERVANVRPEGLAEPRGGVKDNLQQIKGITPALEISLNHLGIFHLDQIGAWDGQAVVWLDQHLGLKGGITRGQWVEQARDLLSGSPQRARPVRH